MTFVIYNSFTFELFFIILSSFYVPLSINKYPRLLRVALFSLHIHFQYSLYCQYTQTTFPMYLLLYYNNTTFFRTFCTLTYSSHKIESILTYGNFLSFSDSNAMVFLYFLKTNNIYGYLVTPVVTDALYDHQFSAHTPTIVLCHTIQHLLHFTHTSPLYAKTSFQNSLPKSDVPKYVQSYIHIKYLS